MDDFGHVEWRALDELHQGPRGLLDGNGLLDAGPDPALDRIARLAASIMGAAAGVLTGMRGQRQVFARASGPGEPAARPEAPSSYGEQVMRTGRPLAIGDAPAGRDGQDGPVDSRADGPADQRPGAVAYLGVPVFIEGTAIGALGVVEGKPRSWTAEQVEQLADLARTVASLLELRLAAWRADSRFAPVEALAERQAAGEPDLRRADERSRAIVQHLPGRDALASEHALLETMIAHIDDGVALLDPERRILLANDRYCEILGIDRTRARGMARDEFLVHMIPLLEDPEKFRAQFAATPTSPTSEEFTFARPQRRVMRRSWTPLGPDQGGGFLVTWHDVTAQHDLLHERERQLLIDPLTGIANRRAGDLALRTEHERLKRAGTPMSIALFDVDHFKRVNDRFGHAVGDQVLCAVAATLKDRTRLTDTVARWGGEEFLAVLNVPLESAKAFCERVRRTIEALECPPVERLTISAGVAELSGNEMIADALARADRYLYEAKSFGRNRICG